MTKAKKAKLPAPPLPADLNFQKLPFMPLFVETLKKSRAWAMARSTPFLGFYLINLWTAAWTEIPACSLPSDDDSLAERAGCDLKAWGKVRDKAMHKFVLHSDGRYYHPEQVKYAEKVIESREKDAAKKRRLRGGKGEENQGPDGASPPPSRGTGGVTMVGSRQGQAGAKASNLELRTKKLEEEVDVPCASSTSDHDYKKYHGEDARDAAPKFQRHIGEKRTMAQALNSGRRSPVHDAIPQQRRIKNPQRADADMVTALERHGPRDEMGHLPSRERAFAIVFSARDPRDPNHKDNLHLCERLSQKYGLGWFGDETIGYAQVLA